MASAREWSLRDGEAVAPVWVSAGKGFAIFIKDSGGVALAEVVLFEH